MKLYCDCFSAGKKCVDACSCIKCANNDDPANAAEREQAVKRLKNKKGAWAFRGTSKEDKVRACWEAHSPCCLLLGRLVVLTAACSALLSKFL